MHVVLDASVVIKEGYGNSTLFQFLLSESQAVGHSICIPGVVIEEVVAGFGRVFERETSRIGRSLEILSKNLSRDVQSPISNRDNKKEETLLRSRLRASCNVLGYPNIQHKILVKRAVDRRRPFDETGSGYRDALIWECILRLASKVSDRVVLLSDDKDFCDDTGKLHPTLMDDLVSRGQQKDKVVVVHSLKEFVDTYIRPILKVFEDSSGQASTELGRDLKDTIGLSIQDAYSGEEWQPEQLGIVREYETLHLAIVEDIPDLSVVDLREASDGRLLLKIKATLDCEFDAFVLKSNMYSMDDISVLDYDWNDYYVLAEVSLTLRCELNLLFSASGQPSIEVLSMEPITEDPLKNP